MENIVKISAIAISAVLCASVLKKQVPEIALVLSLLAGAIIMFVTLPALKSIRQLVELLSELADLSPAVLTPVIKTTGIAIITKVTVEICKDAKENGLSAFVEISGCAGALLVCLPLLEIVLQMISGFL